MKLSKKAFSLIELLVVIAIIGILTGISVVGVQAARARSRDSRRITDLNRVQASLVQYYNVEKYYPGSGTDVTQADVYYDNLSGSLDPKYIKPLPHDPGTNKYNYISDGLNFALWVPVETNSRYAKDTEDGGKSDAVYEIGGGDNWTNLLP